MEKHLIQIVSSSSQPIHLDLMSGIWGKIQGDSKLSDNCRRLVYKNWLTLIVYDYFPLFPIPNDFLLGTFHQDTPKFCPLYLVLILNEGFWSYVIHCIKQISILSIFYFLVNSLTQGHPNHSYSGTRLTLALMHSFKSLKTCLLCQIVEIFIILCGNQPLKKPGLN